MNLVTFLYDLWLLQTAALWFGIVAVGIVLRRLYRGVPLFAYVVLMLTGWGWEIACAEYAAAVYPSQGVSLENVIIRNMGRAPEVALIWLLFFVLIGVTNGKSQH